MVCRQLGFLYAKSFGNGYTFGTGAGPIWLDSVNCRGYESSLKECNHLGWRVHYCALSENVGVNCHDGKFTRIYAPNLKSLKIPLFQ